MTREERIAYIAGIIDGEAYVGIKRSTYEKRRGRARSPIYHERVQIRMGCRAILDLIKRTFGGSLGTEPRIYQSTSGFTSRKIMHIYRATDACAARLIESVRPFLIEKARQADAIVALRASKESKIAARRGSPARRPMRKSVLALRDRLYQRVRSIHAR